MVVVLINNNATVSNLEEIIIHELLRLKLWDMDQMIEGYVNIVFGIYGKISKKEFAMEMFFKELESTVEDLAKGYLEANGGDNPCTNRLEKMIKEEIGQ